MPKSKLRKKVQKAHAHEQDVGIGAWNMVIGFSFIGFGFTLATKWR